ncbi:MAG: CDGSH iron-sulfur domain-containing protein [Woeseiaceae bacterium]|nr:CDGSH iron-sulfur domain-containing protein [Woeseiaceae bacterium]
MSRKSLFEYKGKQATVTWDGKLCIHIGECGRAKGDLAIEGAPTEVPGLKFRAALCRCGQSKNKPYCDNSHESAGFQDYGAVGERGDAANDNGGTLQINFAKDGPVLVNGNLCVKSASGREAWHGKRAALCRCGASNNKPFCDSQHKKIGFKSD